jgi:hypothetical protein
MKEKEGKSCIRSKEFVLVLRYMKGATKVV